MQKSTQRWAEFSFPTACLSAGQRNTGRGNWQERGIKSPYVFPLICCLALIYQFLNRLSVVPYFERGKNKHGIFDLYTQWILVPLLDVIIEFLNSIIICSKFPNRFPFRKEGCLLACSQDAVISCELNTLLNRKAEVHYFCIARSDKPYDNQLEYLVRHGAVRGINKSALIK